MNKENNMEKYMTDEECDSCCDNCMFCDVYYDNNR